MHEKIELHIPSLLGSEKLAMERAASQAKMMGFSEDRIEDLKTAVSEACANAIEHGNKFDEAASVGVTLTPTDSSLTITVEDQGSWTKEDFDKAMEKIPVLQRCPHKDLKGKRGWGIYLIKNLVNEVTFEPKKGGGNQLTLIVRLTQQEARGC